MKKRKRIVAFLAMLILCVSTCENVTYAANDANDAKAATYGFCVDNEMYKASVWYDSVTTKVYSGSDVIGVCTTKIGMTRTKDNGGGNYIDHVFVKCTMKGKCPKSSKAGYSEHLKISSKLPSKTSLAGYSPESVAAMKSYEIGADFSGISGSTTVTQKALQINNYSDTSEKLVKICYDYENNWVIPSGYETYGKYAYNESIQRMQFAISTSKSKYGMSIFVTPKFEEMFGTGYWSPRKYKYYSVEQEILFTTPY